jgi:hypothetical protein
VTYATRPGICRSFSSASAVFPLPAEPTMIAGGRSRNTASCTSSNESSLSSMWKSRRPGCRYRTGKASTVVAVSGGSTILLSSTAAPRRNRDRS